jgi:hypothetical protein
MSCDDVRGQVNGGTPLDAEILKHVACCAACGDEFAWLRAVRESHPSPSPELRARVLTAFVRRRPRWIAPGWAAMLAIGVGIGYAGAEAVRPPAPAPAIRIVKIEVETPLTDQQVAVLAVALVSQYGKYVNVEFEGTTCRKIRATQALCRITCCPIVREVNRLAKERPELVELR